MSTVISKNIQVGTSGTATNNFNWYQPASPDGTVRLGVGNYGATTLDAITVSNTGAVTFSGAISSSAAASLNINGTVGATTASTGRFTSLKYDFSAATGGLNIQETGSFNDNSAHSFSSRGAACGVAYITSGSGITAIPWFSNAGGGVGYTFTILDPDSGTWTYGNTVTFTSLGTGANTYSFSVSNGAGQPSITRTSGSTAYTIYIAILMTQ